MKISYTPRFIRNSRTFSQETHTKLEKQIRFLLRDLKYPSLHAKKYDEPSGIWQARVDDSVRFYFEISSDTYILLDIRRYKN